MHLSQKYSDMISTISVPGSRHQSYRLHRWLKTGNRGVASRNFPNRREKLSAVVMQQLWQASYPSLSCETLLLAVRRRPTNLHSLWKSTESKSCTNGICLHLQDIRQNNLTFFSLKVILQKVSIIRTLLISLETHFSVNYSGVHCILYCLFSFIFSYT